MERPSRTILRFCASAARTTLSTRWMFDPNIATTTRPFASGPPKMRIKDSPTSRSLTPVPSRSALVESESRQATPVSPSSAKRRTSRSFLSTGLQSILKSPVWMTRPASVRKAYPTASGTLCGTWSGSKSVCRPTLPIARGETSRRSAEMACSASFSRVTARVKRVPYTGVSGNSRKR